MTRTNPDGAAWTAERIRALGPVADLTTAAAILRISRAAAYQLARQGQFPIPLLRVGTRYRVPVAALVAALHLDDPPPTRLDPSPDQSVDHHAEISSTPTGPTAGTNSEGTRDE